MGYDDDFMVDCEKLSEEIKKSGRFDPPVEMPIDIEGHHRIMAYNLLGKKTIPIYKCIILNVNE